MESSRKGLPDPGFVNGLDIAQSLSLRFSERLPGRRGGAFRYAGSDGSYIMKAVDEDAATDFPAHLEPRAATIAREAQVLKALGAIAGNVYVADGKDGSIVWLLTREIVAPNAMRVCDEIRGSGSQRHIPTRFREIFASIAGKVADLHEAGFLHGDLQPPHILIGSAGEVFLLDFELARRIDDRETRYTGSLVHYNAPEIAEGMLERAEHISYDVLSEVYSLGAVLFTLYTREPLPDYGTKDQKALPLDEKLHCIIEGRKQGFASTNSPPYPELEALLKWAVADDRTQRCPSARELARRLGETRG